MSVLDSYERFLLANGSQITAVESSLRSLTYFLPGRFKDAELAGEAIYSALNILGMYHDSILIRLLGPARQPSAIGLKPTKAKAITSSSSTNGTGNFPALPATNDSQLALASSTTELSPSSALSVAQTKAAVALRDHTPSQHARYTHFFSDNIRPYHLIARILVIIKYVELLLEMFARRKLGESTAWNVVAGIEAIKAALRIAILRLTVFRPTVEPPIPEREVDPAVLEQRTLAELAAAAQPPPANMSASVTHLNGHVGGMSGSVMNGHNLSSSVQSLDSYSSQRAASKEYWTGTRTGYTLPTIASIRARTGGGTPANAAEALKLARQSRHLAPPPPISSMSISTGSSGSGSESEETLVGTPLTDKEVNEFLLSRTLTPTDVRKPPELVRPLRGRVGVTAELLWILRPLIYVLAIRRYGRKSTSPWVLSLSLELLARRLRKRSFLNPDSFSSALITIPKSPTAALGANPLALALMGSNPIMGMLAGLLGGGLMGKAADEASRPISDVEKHEWSRRDRNLWWYLVRGPAWYQWTRPKIEGIAKATENRALLSILGGVLRDYLPLLDQYYFYTST
ncbi:hypothetical protein A4X13_0g5476 [Tilletia indica]|uniref:Peroxisomal membrane protein PEX16 n=1 Tax=Tilletia indica TaxID=43049 RepID=A0A177T695_9BASI|nr:hypothetical protein A4X13_0g5476 [Tilletia indica]